MNWDIEVKPFTTTSTMDIARDHALGGAKELTLIATTNQTGGRGRHGRTWFSPKNAGLYLTAILRPQVEHPLPTLGLVAGVATLESIRGFGATHLGLKWPNDIVSTKDRHRKIAGILLEGGDDFVLVGVGINVRSAPSACPPPELLGRYLSIDDVCDEHLSPMDFVAPWTTSMVRHYHRWLKSGVSCITDTWATDDVLKDQTIEAQWEGSTIKGLARGLGPDGSLRVETTDGLINVSSGIIF